MKTHWKLANTLFLVACLSACSTQPVVTSQARVGAQLNAYKTYAFKASAGIDAYGNASIASAHMKAAIRQEMSVRGYVYSESTPNLWIDFNTSIVSRAKKNAGPTLSLGMFGSHGGVSLGVPVSSGGANDQKVNRIFLELLDTTRKEVVWQGAYEAVLSERDLAEPSLALYAGVHSIYSRFPIK